MIVLKEVKVTFRLRVTWTLCTVWITAKDGVVVLCAMSYVHGGVPTRFDGVTWELIACESVCVAQPVCLRSEYSSCLAWFVWFVWRGCLWCFAKCCHDAVSLLYSLMSCSGDVVRIVGVNVVGWPYIICKFHFMCVLDGNDIWVMCIL